MRARTTPVLHRPLAAAAALALAAGFAVQVAPAKAQDTYVGEVVITAPYRTGPEGPARLSRVVYVGDLDLTTFDGQRALKHRIRATARDVCRELGEGSGNGGPLMRSCEEQAYQDARPQMRVAVNRAYEASAYAYASSAYAADASAREPVYYPDPD
jgi:UrcA family protein